MPRAKSKKCQDAEDWYISHPGITYKEVAENFQTTEKTIGAWAKKFDWPTRQLDFLSSPVKVKQLLQQEVINVVNGKAASFNADSVSKLMSAIDKVDSRANPYVVSDILVDLDRFIAERDPKLAIEASPLHRQFLIHRINLEG